MDQNDVLIKCLNFPFRFSLMASQISNNNLLLTFYSDKRQMSLVMILWRLLIEKSYVPFINLTVLSGKYSFVSLSSSEQLLVTYHKTANLDNISVIPL